MHKTFSLKALVSLIKASVKQLFLSLKHLKNSEPGIHEVMCNLTAVKADTHLNSTVSRKSAKIRQHCVQHFHSVTVT